MAFKVITPPASEIFAAVDLRGHLGLEAGESDLDPIVSDYIAAARAKAQTYTRKLFLTQTVLATFDGFARGRLCLPVGPVQSVTKVEYRPDGGAWQEIPDTDYRAYLAEQPGYLMPPHGGTWPTTAFEPECVRVTYVAGFGDDRTAVHSDILQAIRLMVADAFVNRGDEELKPFPRNIHPGAECLLASHREWF